jgi:hypothetical protein
MKTVIKNSAQDLCLQPKASAEESLRQSKIKIQNSQKRPFSKHFKGFQRKKCALKIIVE